MTFKNKQEALDMLKTVMIGVEIPIVGPGSVDSGTVDIILLDTLMTKNDPEYDGENCTYQGKEGYSMRDYVIAKYGQDAAQAIEVLMEFNTPWQ